MSKQFDASRQISIVAACPLKNYNGQLKQGSACIHVHQLDAAILLATFFSRTTLDNINLTTSTRYILEYVHHIVPLLTLLL